MLKLPEKINQSFQQLLINKGLSDKDRNFYSKWLRFYWDFCHKYHHSALDQNSLPLFLTKLREKGQSEAQRKQATMAITFFYEMSSSSNENQSDAICDATHLPSSFEPAKDDNSTTQNLHYNYPESKHEPTVKADTSHSIGKSPSQSNLGASWVFVFDALVSEIKMRHYSPKTLKAYRKN